MVKNVRHSKIVKSVCGPATGPVSPNLESLEEEESGHEYDHQDHQLDLAYEMGLSHLGTAGKLSPLGVVSAHQLTRLKEGCHCQKISKQRHPS